MESVNTMKSSHSVLVVLSGGQDSATCLFWAAKNFKTVHAITFDYGQRHARELEAATNLAKLAGVASHEIVQLGPILKGRSPLTDHSIGLEQYEDYATMDATIGDRVELTFVPMRNALFLTLAANRAVCLGIADLVTGVCQEDNANYPDCRHSFVVAQQQAVEQALGLPVGSFFIHTPLMHLTKAESVRFAMSLGCYGELCLSHTAYDGAYPPVGHDHATILRAHGFEEAGVPDPLLVRAWMEGAIAHLPDTDNYSDTSTVANVRMLVSDTMRRLRALDNQLTLE